MEEKTITLPIHPAVKKFVLKDLSAEPIICSQNNLAGRQVLNLLVKKSAAKKSTDAECTIQLVLSADLWQHRRKIIRAAKSGKLFMDYFKVALRHFVNGAAPFMHSRRLAIYAFLDFYGIEEDELRYDTVERMFHSRHNVHGNFNKYHKNELMETLIEKNLVLKQAVAAMGQALALLEIEKKQGTFPS